MSREIHSLFNSTRALSLFISDKRIDHVTLTDGLGRKIECSNAKVKLEYMYIVLFNEPEINLVYDTTMRSYSNMHNYISRVSNYKTDFFGVGCSPTKELAEEKAAENLFEKTRAYLRHALIV